MNVVFDTDVVTEDKHLRRLGNWHSIQIMNGDDFMTELDRLGIP